MDFRDHAPHGFPQRRRRLACEPLALIRAVKQEAPGFSLATYALDTPRADAWLHGYGEAAILAMVNQGKVNQMPAQTGKLTEAQIHVLTGYVWGFSNK